MLGIRPKIYCGKHSGTCAVNFKAVTSEIRCYVNRRAVNVIIILTSEHSIIVWPLSLSKPSRCVSIQLVYIFTSYTTINIIIHTIKCYKFNGYMFRSPLRLSSGQLLHIVRLHCAYNMGSNNVYIIFYIWSKITVKSLHC